MNDKGMTLKDLLILLGIILVIIFFATPRGLWPSSKSIRRAREASTKGHLGALRSALNIYFSEHGSYPARDKLDEKPFIGVKAENYIDEIPKDSEYCKLYRDYHEANSKTVQDFDLGATGTEDGGWAYFTPAGSSISPKKAEIRVNCGQLDSKKTVISTW